MPNPCIFPLCTRYAAKDKEYCVSHRLYSESAAVKELPKPIAKKSEKMKVEDKLQAKFNKMFLAKPENKYCAIQIDENCTRTATTVNHKKRRGKDNKRNELNCEPSCSYCNIKIEEKDGWARDNGHLQSKYN